MRLPMRFLRLRPPPTKDRRRFTIPLSRPQSISKKLPHDTAALLGVIGGILLTINLEHILAAIEAVVNVTLLPSDVYYITGLPYELDAGEVVLIAAVALTMSFLATLYPAWRAARTQPAEALRYE